MLLLPKERRVAFAGHTVKQLNIVAAFNEAAFATMLADGGDSVQFRMAVASLTNELCGKNIPSDRKDGFFNPVVKALKQVYCTCPLSDLETSEDDRLELVEYLAGEVSANRMLEAKRYASLSTAANARAKGVVTVDSTRKLLNAGLRPVHVARGVAQLTREAPMQQIVDAIEKVFGATDKNAGSSKLLKRADFNEKELDALRAVFSEYHASYAQRRTAMIHRFRLTLQALCQSDTAKTDKQSLRRLSDGLVSQLTQAPPVEFENIFDVNRAVVAAAFMKVSSSTAAFKDSSYRMPAVKDRGGRVNTHNFDDKVVTAVRKADAGLKQNSDTSNKQRDDARKAMDTDRKHGVGLAAQGASYARSDDRRRDDRRDGGRRDDRDGGRRDDRDHGRRDRDRDGGGRDRDGEGRGSGGRWNRGGRGGTY